MISKDQTTIENFLDTFDRICDEIANATNDIQKSDRATALNMLTQAAILKVKFKLNLNNRLLKVSLVEVIKKSHQERLNKLKSKTR